MAVVTLTSGKTFESAQGVSILNAAAMEKITIPYSCKTGRCSTCKCKLVRGTTRALQMEVGLTEDEKADGWILSCVRTVESDSLLEIDDLGDIELPGAKTLPCRISKIEKLTTDVVRVLLRLPPTADFHFIPGQYIDVIGPSGVRRSYSLANASFSDKLLELHVQAVNGGAMSDYWFNHAKANDLLRLNGPLGTFFLRECAYTDVFFLATGTGIAPVKAMLESLIQVSEERQPQSITVLWGGRKPEDFYVDIAGIPGKHRFIPVVSRPSESWMGAKGYVQDILLSTAADLSKAAVYACGSDRMIHSAKQILANAGLPLAHFHSDAFVSSGNI